MIINLVAMKVINQKFDEWDTLPSSDTIKKRRAIGEVFVFFGSLVAQRYISSLPATLVLRAIASGIGTGIMSHYKVEFPVLQVLGT